MITRATEKSNHWIFFKSHQTFEIVKKKKVYWLNKQQCAVKEWRKCDQNWPKNRPIQQIVIKINLSKTLVNRWPMHCSVTPMPMISKQCPTKKRPAQWDPNVAPKKCNRFFTHKIFYYDKITGAKKNKTLIHFNILVHSNRCNYSILRWLTQVHKVTTQAAVAVRQQHEHHADEVQPIHDVEKANWMLKSVICDAWNPTNVNACECTAWTTHFRYAIKTDYTYKLFDYILSSWINNNYRADLYSKSFSLFFMGVCLFVCFFFVSFNFQQTLKLTNICLATNFYTIHFISLTGIFSVCLLLFSHPFFPYFFALVIAWGDSTREKRASSVKNRDTHIGQKLYNRSNWHNCANARRGRNQWQRSQFNFN